MPNPKRNKVVEAEKQKRKTAKQIEEAVFSGIKYGMFAQEIITFSFSNRLLEEEQKLSKEVMKKITSEIIILEDLVKWIYENYLTGNYKDIEEYKDELVTYDPRLGAYF